MKIKTLLIAILAAGVGLAPARFEFRLNPVSNGVMRWFDAINSGFFIGVALVGWLAMLAEVASSTFPRPAGLGRWTWLYFGPLVLFKVLQGLFYFLADYGLGWSWNKPEISMIYLYQTLYYEYSFAPLLALPVLFFVLKPGPARRDAAEWSGRAFLVVYLTSLLAEHMLDGWFRLFY